MTTEHHHFTSSDVSEASYDNEKHELTVEFMTGARYLYYEVKPSMWREFTNASSAGSFVHETLHALHYKRL
jgi:hypothetical protein